MLVCNCRIKVITLKLEKNENFENGDLKDYVRKWDFSFYTKRPFRSSFHFYEGE